MFLLGNGLLPRAKWSFNRIHYEVKCFVFLPLGRKKPLSDKACDIINVALDNQ